MSFEEMQLAAPIKKAIKLCGYTEPTPIQEKAIPEVLAGRDVIASAQTGTGKTAAFMLPMLERLSQVKKGPKGAPRVLVLTPTRELAAQSTEATRNYGKFLNVRSTVILGGSSYVPQFRDLGRSIDLVVGTPGRLIDHLNRGSLDLSCLEVLILDEADRLQKELSRFYPVSDISRINLLYAGEHTQIGADTLEVLKLAYGLWCDTAGAFDVTVGSKTGLDCSDGLYGFNGCHIDPDAFTVSVLLEGLQFDLGGIGKGYALDRMADLLEDWDIATALLHSGESSVLPVGTPVAENAWSVALRHPDNERPDSGDTPVG